MATTTEYLGLTLPEKTEYFDLDVFNENFQAIDGFAKAVGALETMIDTELNLKEEIEE